MDKNNNGSILLKFAIFIKIPPPLDEKMIESSKKDRAIKYKVKIITKIKNGSFLFCLR